jgi:hypothetical protein
MMTIDLVCPRYTNVSSNESAPSKGAQKGLFDCFIEVLKSLFSCVTGSASLQSRVTSTAKEMSSVSVAGKKFRPTPSEADVAKAVAYGKNHAPRSGTEFYYQGHTFVAQPNGSARLKE